ncbi:MAG: cupin domain-containing protein [Candidatus Bathyarchaeota archaeon]|nr:cupin domain-containing protein [Candidatus Bathyarchaeota archaeon]
MFKRNWKEIEPRLAYDETCYVRDYFRRKDQLSFEGGYKVTHHIEWVRRTAIRPGKRLPYRKQNLEEVIYILQGEGIVQAGEKKHNIKAWDTIYIPPETPHTLYSTVENQPLIYMDYAVRTPPDAGEIQINEASMDEKVESDVHVRRWTAIRSQLKHNNTCWVHTIFGKDTMKYIHSASIMTVPEVLGYHRHNTETTYYIDSGAGFMKQGGEEAAVQAGDAVYNPPQAAHRCWSSLKEQPLNVFCLGVAVPYDAQTWVEEDLPDLPV